MQPLNAQTGRARTDFLRDPTPRATIPTLLMEPVPGPGRTTAPGLFLCPREKSLRDSDA